jgi:hypothetical protein
MHALLVRLDDAAWDAAWDNGPVGTPVTSLTRVETLRTTVVPSRL